LDEEENEIDPTEIWEEVAPTFISVPADDETEEGMSQCNVVDHVAPFSFIKTLGIGR